MLFESLDERTRLIAYRELVLTGFAALLVTIPAFFSIGIAAWVAIGSLLALTVVHPRALVLAVPLTIPLSFQSVELGDLQFNMLEVLVLIAILGHVPRVLRVIWELRTTPSEERYRLMHAVFPDRFVAGIAILLVIAGGISTLFLADPTFTAETLRTLRWTILLPVAFVFMATPILFNSELLRTLAAALFVAGAVISAVIALGDGLLGGGIQAESVTRLSGIAPHPNALALVLDRAAVLGLLIALAFRRSISRSWLVPSALIAVVTLLTFSRGAMLGLTMGLLLVLLLTRATRPAIIVAGTGLAGLAWFIATAPERALSLLGGGSGSLRLHLWESSLQMISDHSLTGVGLDQFLYQYVPRYVHPEAWPERFTSHPHNLFLDSWLSLGIIGVVIVALVGVLMFRRVRTAIDTEDRVSIAAAGAMVTVAIHGMVDQSYFLPELAFSAWLLIILLIPTTPLDAGPGETIEATPEDSEG
jgi:putative inorganic carbon (hco3(-)) transporter